MVKCSLRHGATSSRQYAFGKIVRFALGSGGRVACLMIMFALGLVVSSQYLSSARADGVSVVATNVGLDGMMATGDGGHYGFYAQGRYWAYYSDNVNEVLKSSTDGVAWSAPTVIRPVVFGEYFSGAFDGTYFHYAYADGYNAANVLYRRGTPNSDGSITWSAAEQVVQTCPAWHHTGDISCWYPAIGVDSTGHPWVGWVNGGQVGGQVFSYVSKSSTTDGTWSTAGGFPFAVYTTYGGNSQVHIVPLTATKMYFTYAGMSDYVYGRLWNGAAFGSQETISAAPISSDAFGGTHVTAVNMGDDVHLVYLNTDAHTYIYYKRTYSQGTWSTGATIATNIAGDSGHISSFPAMAVNGTELYLFWLGSPDPDHAYYLTYSGGSWVPTRTDWLADPHIADVRDLGVFYSPMSNRLGFFYESGESGYTLKFSLFHVGATIQSPMTVSYTVVGGGSGYSAPIFNYVHSGVNQTYPLTESPAEVSCDAGSAWSVTPNPLAGSGTSERWLSSQTLSGAASTLTLVFSFQHLYLLTMQINPPGSGSTSPSVGTYWYAAGFLSPINATESQGYIFQSWTGSGSGSYTGPTRTSPIVMNAAIAETANFSPAIVPATMTASYQINGGGTGYSAPTFNYVHGGSSMQYALTGTPTGITCDPGSVWFVTTNPLSGSGLNERWYSIQTLSGTASTQTIVFNFQHQYMLSLDGSQPGGGSTAPASGWQNADATVSIQATADPGYTFQSWAGSGTGSYSGTNNPASITVSSPISETANFYLSQQGEATMTVSYTVVGNGAPTVPIFNYVQGGQSKQRALTLSPTAITVDAGTPWTVTSNPLGGSNNLERWYSTQSLSGTASLQTLALTFQHQYYLIMQGSTYYGSVDPDTGWQNAGAQIQLTVTPQSGHTFQAWVGSGSGSYSGPDNPASITMNSPITEVANFASELAQSQTGICKFSSGGQAALDGEVYYYKGSEVNTYQSAQLPFTLLGTVGTGAFMNRRWLRWLNKRGGHRGGISKMVAALILIVFVVAGIAGISLYYSAISGGAVSHQDMLLTGSIIKVNAAEDSGSVYVKIHNAGMSAATVSTITVSGHLRFTVNFTDATGRVPSGWACTCSGSQGVAVGGNSPNGYLVIPSGADVSILASALAGMTSYFTPGTAYDVSIMLRNGPELRFTIPAESSP